MGRCRCGCGGWDRCVSFFNPCDPQATPSNVFPTSGALVVQNSWNIPACSANATLNVPGLKSAQVGGYIWNPTYGYLKVVSFDAVLGQMTVTNECQSGNASPGTVVPACTPFMLADGGVVPTPWIDFATTFAAMTSSGSAPTGVTVSDAKYKIDDLDSVDFYVTADFTIVGTPQFIFAPMPVPAFNTLYQGLFHLYMQDASGPLETAYVDFFPDTSTLRFQSKHGTGNFTAGPDARIRLNGRYRKA